jgi:AraC-like DNA-binding protein
VGEHLEAQAVTMQWTAQQLGMSVATLRRRLGDEDMTFTSLVDGVRQELAERELREGRASIGEIAYALGFANLGTFARAFKRWRGAAPSDFRARLRDH